MGTNIQIGSQYFFFKFSMSKHIPPSCTRVETINVNANFYLSIIRQKLFKKQNIPRLFKTHI